jgi:hypothetical protein
MPGLESSDRFYYRFEGIEGTYSIITVSSDLVTSTTLPSSTPSISDPTIQPTLDPVDPPLQIPWPYYLLSTLAVVCIITIIVIVVTKYGLSKKIDTVNGISQASASFTYGL